MIWLPFPRVISFFAYNNKISPTFEQKLTSQDHQINFNTNRRGKVPVLFFVFPVNSVYQVTFELKRNDILISFPFLSKTSFSSNRREIFLENHPLVDTMTDTSSYSSF